MSGLSPDPKMMREQQDKDAPETIERDETARRADRSDLDPKSASDRKAANHGADTQSANETMDDVFEGNRGAAGGGAADRMMTDAATDGNASLVRRGRSLLGQ